MGDADGAVRRGPGVPRRHRRPAQGSTAPPGRFAHGPRPGGPTGRLTLRTPMPAPTPILDPTSLDFTRVIADREAIRRVNPHRGNMEHLTAIVYMDTKEHVIAGYKDVRADEFWAAGHFPNFPLLPG